MTPERWRQIRGIFDRVVEQSTVARNLALDQECGADPELRHDVEALIHSYRDSGSFIDEPVARLDPTNLLDRDLLGTDLAAPAEPVTPEYPEWIGVYRVVGPIGQGGMGDVLLARRDDDVYQQDVAIKLLKAGLASPSMIRRFRSERQILANLRHPAIAQLLDGGTTAAHQPYLVMEHIDGTPIDVYCDRERLTIPARLELFRKVCDAVHFAHQNLVVHRDIKPSNILITATGEPKLLDFGIAKLLRPEAFPEAVEVTETGMVALTPEYASPEQLQGQVITTASDVYSLGVLLFILLTGRRPYELDRGNPLEVMRKVCEEMPLKPSLAARDVTTLRELTGLSPGASTRTATLDSPSSSTASSAADETIEPPTLELVSSARGTDPRGLRRQLSGDLDTIVLRALAKEPQRRYSSAEQFGQDLGRYLGGQPVLARKDTVGYRARKFVQRHRAGVGVTLGIFGLLVAFLVALLIQRDEIIARGDRLQRVSDFLAGVFAYPDPNRARGETITARELLDRAAKDIERDLAAEPKVRADLLTIMGRTYRNLGLNDEAERLLETALELHRGDYGEGHPSVALDLYELAGVHLARGKYGGGRSLHQRALEIRQRFHGTEHPEVVESLVHLAHANNLTGDLEDAEAIYRQALDSARRLDQRDLLATVLDRYGVLLIKRAEYDAAEAMLLKALDIYDQLYGELHPEAALCRNNLAALHEIRGDYETAEALYRETVGIQQRLFGGAHAHLAMTLNNLGLVLKKGGRLDEAEEILGQALTMRTEIYGDEHPLLAASLIQMADLARAHGELDLAEEMVTEALALRRKLLGDQHPDTATSLDRLAQILVDKGDYDTAESMYREALAISLDLFGDRHPGVGTRLNNLADLAFTRGRLDDAAELYDEALEIHIEALGDDHPTVASILYNLASLVRARGDVEAADRRFAAAVEAGIAALGEDHLNVALAKTGWAELKNARGEHAEAEELAKRAVPVLAEGLGPDHGWTVAAQCHLGEALRQQQKSGEAEPFLEVCREHHRQASDAE